MSINIRGGSGRPKDESRPSPLQALAMEFGYERTHEFITEVLESQEEVVPGICVKCGSMDDSVVIGPDREECYNCGRLSMRSCFALAGIAEKVYRERTDIA